MIKVQDSKGVVKTLNAAEHVNNQDGAHGADAPIAGANNSEKHTTSDFPSLSLPASTSNAHPPNAIHVSVIPTDVDRSATVAEKTAAPRQPSDALEAVHAPTHTSKREEENNHRVNSTSKAFQKVVDDELQKEYPNFELISQYLDFDASLLYVDPETQGTVLHGAAFAGATNIVRVALDQKVDVNATNVYGRTALHVAAANNKDDVVQILINAKSDVNALTLGGMTPLHLSVRARGVEATKVLLAHEDIDCNVENSERRTPLMLSSDSTITKMIEERDYKRQSAFFRIEF